MLDRHSAYSRELSSLTNSQRRSLRISVYAQTMKSVKAGGYSLPSGERVTLDTERLLMSTDENVQVSSSRDLILQDFEPVDTRVIVFRGDCLEAAIQMKNLGYEVAVLNMASASKPGGGVEGGAGAQEENLFRRSNYFQHLYNKAKVRYPLQPEGGVFSPRVCVFREAEAARYEFMREPVELAFIAVAAIRKPSLVQPDSTYSPTDELLMKEKVKTIFTLAASNNKDCIILSAFGCGAYCNPPFEVARVFKEVLESTFHGRFRRVVFAIFDDHNASKEHNPLGNVQPFAQVFGCDVLDSLEALS